MFSLSFPHLLNSNFVKFPVFGPGIIDTLTPVAWLLLNTIFVAKRVQSPLSRGRGNSMIASSTDDLPLDWSPTTTSWGRATTEPIPSSRSLSIVSIWAGFERLRDFLSSGAAGAGAGGEVARLCDMVPGVCVSGSQEKKRFGFSGFAVVATESIERRWISSGSKSPMMSALS